MVSVAVCHGETSTLTFYTADHGKDLFDWKSCPGSHGTLLTQTSHFCVFGLVYIVLSMTEALRQKLNFPLDFRCARQKSPRF